MEWKYTAGARAQLGSASAMGVEPTGVAAPGDCLDFDDGQRVHFPRVLPFSVYDHHCVLPG